ncbi:MAG: O-acetyl-ADP-ribose deacetylase [Candidatus Heimdallarchaeota archaeon LC_3]|nr:MAG: O-acetyl-ADP-ribose deacetylase [Candidatus Heimdallarchaeota archaeon LC_3]
MIVEYVTKFGKTKIILKKGDITKQKTNVIVNAANTGLLGGGGVDGAIHQAAGPNLMSELKKKFEYCATGDLVVTGSGNLQKNNVKYIFHAVGPVWQDGTKNESNLLSSCYNKSIIKLKELNLNSISFPSISTGIYGYPIIKASEIALKTVINLIIEKENEFESIYFILFSDSDFSIYLSVLEEIFK